MDDNSDEKNYNADCCILKSNLSKTIPRNNNIITGKHCVEVNDDNSTIYHHLPIVDGKNHQVAECMGNHLVHQHHNCHHQLHIATSNNSQHNQLNCVPNENLSLYPNDIDQCCLINNSTINGHSHNAGCMILSHPDETINSDGRKSNDNTEATEENRSNSSTSTDNLSLISDENDLINDIVIVPNLISDDEVSVNSDDCVYAYRGDGGDIDLVNGTHATGASQDDETDFLEMDFEPDPPSEIEIFPNTNDHNAMPINRSIATYKNSQTINSGILDDDYKIPREIDKIAEVVELNNSRTKDIVDHSVNDHSKIINQRLSYCSMDNSNSDNVYTTFTTNNPDSVIPTFETVNIITPPEKYTGTIPKIKSTRQKTNDENRMPTDSNNGCIKSELMLNKNDQDLHKPLTKLCFDNCEEDHILYGNSNYWSTGISTQCNKCQLKPKISPLYCGKGLDYIDGLCCTYPNQKISANNSSTRESYVTNDDLLSYPKITVDYESYTNSISPLPINPQRLQTKFVNIRSTSCTEKDIIDALISIDINPNLEILQKFFNNQNINSTALNIPAYIIQASKQNCNYKALINIIKQASSMDCIHVEFFPNLTAEIETITVSVKEIIERWTINTNLRQILQIKNKRFRTLNVLGKVANIIREFVNKDQSTLCNDRNITIPQYYPSGYITISIFKT